MFHRDLFALLRLKGCLYMEKEIINRQKIVHAEEQKSSKRLAEQLGKDMEAVFPWATIAISADAKIPLHS